MTNYDIWADVGADAAVVHSFPVNISDGTVDLQFITVANEAKVSAIRVVSVSLANNLAASPDPVLFPDQIESTTSTPLTVSLGATGSVDIEIVSMNLTGTNPSDFNIDSAPTTPFTVSPGTPVDLGLPLTPGALEGR